LPFTLCFERCGNGPVRDGIFGLKTQDFAQILFGFDSLPQGKVMRAALHQRVHVLRILAKSVSEKLFGFRTAAGFEQRGDEPGPNGAVVRIGFGEGSKFPDCLVAFSVAEEKESMEWLVSLLRQSR